MLGKVRMRGLYKKRRGEERKVEERRFVGVEWSGVECEGRVRGEEWREEWGEVCVL